MLDASWPTGPRPAPCSRSPPSPRSSASASPRPGTSCTSWAACARSGALRAARADLDFATTPPRRDHEDPAGLGGPSYLVGVRFGTVGALKQDQRLEITTFRQEVYAEEHRKPAVTFAKDIETDLSRRDFTINAMAMELPDGAFVDPYGGVRHLAAKVLDTPLEPEVAFSDDPLRMLRAARFVAQLEVDAGPARRGRDARDARAARDRVGRADPRRARQAAGRGRVPAGLELARRDRRSPTCSCPSCPRCSSSRIPCTGTRTCCATPTRSWRRDRTRSDAAPRGAAARHRQAAPRAQITPEGVQFHHHEVVGARMADERMRELRYPNHDDRRRRRS